MKKSVILISLIALTSSIYAQTNLVPNGGFDQTEKKPKSGLGELELATPWFSPHLDKKADLYSKQIKKKFSIPENDYGYQQVESGDNYVGIRMYGYRDALPRTYLQVKLNSKLIEGKSYCVSFKVALSKISKYASSNIGAHLSTGKLKSKDIDSYTVVPQIIHSNNKVFTEQYLWEEICGVLVAKGGEAYLTIGNFADQNDMDKNKELTGKMKRIKEYSQQQTNDAYYFLDDVSVINMEELSSCKCEEEEGSGNDMKVVYSQNISEGMDMEIAEQIELKKLFFDQNQKKTSSAGVADIVFNLLEENPSIKVEIVGHSDKVENNELSYDISEERAQSVYDYLIEKGIAAERLSIKAVQNTQPFDQSGSKMANAQNRRVEFKVLK